MKWIDYEEWKALREFYKEKEKEIIPYYIEFISRVFNSMSKEQEQLEDLEEYYLSIKYNYSIFDIEMKMYEYITVNLKIDDDKQINKIIEDIVTKYDKDDDREE